MCATHTQAEDTIDVTLDPVNLMLGFAFSTVGFALLRWGRKQGRIAFVVAGLVLFVSPYLCPTPIITLLVCGSILGVLGLAIRVGW
jgi:hypothetical protein